ncbi:hypothetical protein GOP47_0030533 [Adiantum capillus-veneris]|nr:hypothetical protein GOP47_0030533 [Adiantum capillus-veneris]
MSSQENPSILMQSYAHSTSMLEKVVLQCGSNCSEGMEDGEFSNWLIPEAFVVVAEGRQQSRAAKGNFG